MADARDIVVVGASAGGVRALTRLAAGLPSGLPAAVMMVLHVGANTSTLPSLLSAAGPLPAAHARDGERLRHGHIVVAPPDHHVLLDAGVVRVTRGPKEHHTRPAVDPLFRSAALSAGPRVIGVVLTGGLDDGTAGLQAVKACGGLAVVQDPLDAEEAGMPRSALDAMTVDHCVPLAQLAPLLVSLVHCPAPPAPPLPPRLLTEHAASLGGGNGMAELQTIGTPSSLVCPECNGALWELRDVQPPRYRCHTGHGFSLRSLAAAQQEAAEDALWSGLRALQEKELLLRKVAELDRHAGDEPHARRTEQEAERLCRQIETLRRLVESD